MTYQTSEKLPGHPRCVYFVQAATLRLIKIGSTSNLDRRLKLMRTGSPDRLDVVGVMTPDDAWATEVDLHERFAADREHGEWFSPSAELVAFINQNAALGCDHAAQDLIDEALTKAFAARGHVYAPPSRQALQLAAP